MGMGSVVGLQNWTRTHTHADPYPYPHGYSGGSHCYVRRSILLWSRTVLQYYNANSMYPIHLPTLALHYPQGQEAC